MNELDMLKIINTTLDDNYLLGNDCARVCLSYPDKPFYITQDTLVEDVHFSLETITPYQLGIKAISVNVSDLCASLALPEIITISLSLPKNISQEFVREFYEGINAACKKYNCAVSGGDLTRSEKITISICAIGQQKYPTTIGRNTAQIGDKILLCGQVGASSLGLTELLLDPKNENKFTKAHLEPEISYAKIKKLIAEKPDMISAMDTSDGLADAIFKISSCSNVNLTVDAQKLPTLKGFDKKCKELNLNPEDILLFGAEDFALLLTVNEEIAEKLPKKDFVQIGTVEATKKGVFGTVKFSNKIIELNEDMIKSNAYSHFDTQNGEN